MREQHYDRLKPLVCRVHRREDARILQGAEIEILGRHESREGGVQRGTVSCASAAEGPPECEGDAKGFCPLEHTRPAAARRQTERGAAAGSRTSIVFLVNV